MKYILLMLFYINSYAGMLNNPGEDIIEIFTVILIFFSVIYLIGLVRLVTVLHNRITFIIIISSILIFRIFSSYSFPTSIVEIFMLYLLIHWTEAILWWLLILFPFISFFNNNIKDIEDTKGN